MRGSSVAIRPPARPAGPLHQHGRVRRDLRAAKVRTVGIVELHAGLVVEVGHVAAVELVPLVGPAIRIAARPARPNHDLVTLAEVLVAVLLAAPHAVVGRDCYVLESKLIKKQNGMV